jgi:hypothetical protein
MSPAAVLGPLMALAACASVTGPRDESVTEITQERDCFGCATGTTVTLRRDGTAALRNTGKSRFGTSDRSFTGTVTRADFDRLASLAVARGFFELGEEYRDPAVADGAWVINTFVRDGRAKKVLDGNSAGPADLRAVEDAIEAVRARLTWAPSTP